MIKKFNSNQLLSDNVKENILKYKRRIEYFIVLIPLIFIITGFYIEGLINKDYNKFKLFYRFTQEFAYKVNFNILPISLMFLTMVIIIIALYKPNVVYLMWGLSLILLSGLLSYPIIEMYLIEATYQISIMIDGYQMPIAICLYLTVLLPLTFESARVKVVCFIKSGVELFLLSSIVYLELTGEYECLFFIKKFFSLFVSSIGIFIEPWGTVTTVFVSLVFMSLYNKKLTSIIFFVKNKMRINKELIKLKDNDSFETVNVSRKVKIPLMKYKYLPKMGVIIPAFNESTTIVDTVNSLLKSDYNKNNLTIFVVSDGSTDNTVEVLKKEYNMHKTYIDQVNNKIKHKPAKAIYLSYKYNNLILIDKENGGKSDALNLGLEYLPKDVKYVSVIDADSIVDKYAFRTLATRAERDCKVAALTGTILPRNNGIGRGFKSLLLNNVQLFDYLNSFHGERGALGLLNAILIIPGAFGFFRKDVLLELNGYPQDVLAEDGILTVNIQRNKEIKVEFMPEAISYTQVPSTFSDLRKQRIRWFKGLTEILTFIKSNWRENVKLILVFLEYLFIEWFTPILTPLGVCIMIANPKMMTYPIFYFFMLLAITTPIIQGLICFLIESSYREIKFSKLIYLPLTVIISPFMVLWRNDALLDLKNRRWGNIKRY